MTDDLDVDRYLEQGMVGLDQVTLLAITPLAEKQRVPVSTVAAELIRVGITARATRQTQDHKCLRGEINTRFCRICSKPMT